MTLLLFSGSLIVLMATGLPIALALLGSATVLMLYLGVFSADIIAQNLISGADEFTFLAVPFFILAGSLMNAGGLSQRIVKFAIALFGHRKGGLGYVTIFVCVIFAGLSGSAAADAAAVGAIMIPMMTKSGYRADVSAGLTASGSIIAPILPPSIAMILFGIAGGVSITRLLLAGIVPGLLMAVMLLVTWSIVRGKSDVPTLPKQNGAEVWLAFRESLWALALPLIIVVGLRGGVFTPTEAAAVAALYSLLVSVFIYREASFEKLLAAFVETAKLTSVVLFLVAASLASAWLMTIANIAVTVESLMAPLIEHPRLLLLAIIAMVLVIGTALELTPTILILAPILVPVVVEAGIDPVYFGVMLVMSSAIGLVTPPVGTVLNVMCGVARIDMLRLIGGAWPFLLSHVFVLLLLVLFPQIVTVPMLWLAP